MLLKTIPSIYVIVSGMKFPDFRKYFFANIMSFLGYAMLALAVYPKDFPPPILVRWGGESFYTPSPEETDFDTLTYIIVFSVLIAFILFIAEILTRFILNKTIFKNKEKTFFSLALKIPKTLKNAYSIIFYIGFSGSFLFALHVFTDTLSSVFNK